MSRYLVTGFNSETGEIWRGEERDQEGAEHMASSWIDSKPIGSSVTIFETLPAPMPIGYQLRAGSTAKRVLGGVEWLS